MENSLPPDADVIRIIMGPAVSIGMNVRTMRIAGDRANVSICRGHRCRGSSAIANWAGLVLAVIRVSILK